MYYTTNTIIFSYIHFFSENTIQFIFDLIRVLTGTCRLAVLLHEAVDCCLSSRGPSLRAASLGARVQTLPKLMSWRATCCITDNRTNPPPSSPPPHPPPFHLHPHLPSPLPPPPPPPPTPPPRSPTPPRRPTMLAENDYSYTRQTLREARMRSATNGPSRPSCIMPHPTPRRQVFICRRPSTFS